MPAVGLDIGGANLKAAHTSGAAFSIPFELWKNPTQLPAVIRQALERLPAADVIAVTMTGELCDCFETKRQGVTTIIESALSATGSTPSRVWSTEGRFLSPGEACQSPIKVASANWHALATYVGLRTTDYALRTSAILIDIGSTTTDIIPLGDGKPTPRGLTDAERLRSGELIYTGVRRTPLCALLGPPYPAEFFATTLDAYLALGLIPEDPADHNTADDRPATIPYAHARLARMLCKDSETCHQGETLELAREAQEKQVMLLRQALKQVAARLSPAPTTFILSGSGEFLARTLLSDSSFTLSPSSFPSLVTLATELGPARSESACAYAVAMLAQRS
jgi:probable H4MPT-linked C1 transfer pathway protein